MAHELAYVEDEYRRHIRLLVRTWDGEPSTYEISVDRAHGEALADELRMFVGQPYRCFQRRGTDMSRCSLPWLHDGDHRWTDEARIQNPAVAHIAALYRELPRAVEEASQEYLRRQAYHSITELPDDALYVLLNVHRGEPTQREWITGKAHDEALRIERIEASRAGREKGLRAMRARDAHHTLLRVTGSAAQLSRKE